MDATPSPAGTPADCRHSSALKHVAFGSGLYWASTALPTITWRSQPQGSDPLFFATLAAQCLGVLALVALSSRLKSCRAQSMLALAGIVFGIVGLGIQSEVPFPSLEAQTIRAAGITLFGLSFSCFIAFWGIQFVSLDEEQAEATVLGTLKVTLAVFALGSCIPAGPWCSFVALGLKVLGVIPYLGRYCAMIRAERNSSAAPASSEADLRKPLVSLMSSPLSVLTKLPKSFVASRIIFGILNGSLAFLATRCAYIMPNGDFPLFPIALGTGACAFGIACKTVHSPASLLRSTPWLVMGLLTLLTLLSPQPEPLLSVSVAIISSWLSWLLLSYTQLSDLKTRIAIDGTVLSVLEKSLFVVASFCGATLGLLLWELCGQAFDTRFAVGFSEGSMFLCALVSSYLLSNFIGVRERRATIQEVQDLTRDQSALLIEEFSRVNGLTPREADVLTLMVQGYTFTGICEKLSVAESTVRTHVKHIYQKLDLHSRNDLNDKLESFLAHRR